METLFQMHDAQRVMCLFFAVLRMTDGDVTAGDPSDTEGSMTRAKPVHSEKAQVIHKKGAESAE